MDYIFYVTSLQYLVQNKHVQVILSRIVFILVQNINIKEYVTEYLHDQAPIALHIQKESFCSNQDLIPNFLLHHKLVYNIIYKFHLQI